MQTAKIMVYTSKFLTLLLLITSILFSSIVRAEPFEWMDCASCQSCGQNHTLTDDATILYCRNKDHEIDRNSLEYCLWQHRWARNLWDDIRNDFRTYFDPHNLIWVGGAFLIAGICANTGLDKSINRWWQSSVAPKYGHLFRYGKGFGDIGYLYFPIFAGAMYLGHLREETMFGNVVYQWGYRGLRTTLLAGVQQVFFTHALGSGRPKNGADSKWRPFEHNTGVSGHATYGAIPFIVAAQMTDPFFLKAALYIVSTFPGLSRMNSGDHYFSQVFLGWAFAYLSAKAVYNSDLRRLPTFQIGFVPNTNGGKIFATFRF